MGTLPEPGFFTSVGKTLSKWIDLAMGTGLVPKVQQAYGYLMDFWEPEDRVFLFGFSRGAYTAHVLGGLLHALGLLPRGNQNLVPYVARLFKSIRGGWFHRPNQNYWKLTDQFRWSFSRKANAHDDERRFQVHFLGLWDTVSSVGWVWDRVSFPFTKNNPSVLRIRHAVSIDERRAFFRQNLWDKSDQIDLKEQWFPGVHADVGGGYPCAEGGLWRPAFEWILKEAMAADLHVDESRLSRVLPQDEGSGKPWNEPKHESLTALWWSAEFFPKLAWHEGRRGIRFGLGRPRTILAGAVLHEAALRRIQETGYAPPNLSPQFVNKVRQLTNMPSEMPYEP